ncbi:MAG TPA: toxin-antitoxin system HicB family antitoxin [Gaiellaceae bacterium]
MEAAKAHGERAESGSERRRRGRGGAHSGRLLLRMPEALHAELARLSEAEGISLNSFINRVLAGAAGSAGGSGGAVPKASPAAPEEPAIRKAPDAEHSPLVRRLLVANLIVVAAVGALAVALLVSALR